jgi:hypothetical protein
VIHFTNGDIVVGLLREAGVPGRIVACADPLHEGPLVHGLDLAEWRELRARFLAAGGDWPLSEVRDQLARRDEAIEAAASEDEVVLWFEHDLFDQLNLLWLLDALAAAGTHTSRISLIVIGAHPEVPRLHGLGNLSTAQLLRLAPARTTLSADALVEARLAWAEVCADDPRPSVRRAHEASANWQWLPGALRRLWEELPAVGTGLSRTERQGLDAIAAGAQPLGEAFGACSDREERRFLGDWSFYQTMMRLAAAATPLLTIERAGEPAAARATISPFGQQVLGGAGDHAAINGLDRWVGGVRLTGFSPAWRWGGGGVVAG